MSDYLQLVDGPEAKPTHATDYLSLTEGAQDNPLGLKSQSPTYDMSQSLTDQAFNTADRLRQAHNYGWDRVSNQLRGAMVLSGMASYDEVAVDRAKLLSRDAFAQDEALSSKYLPFTNELLVPLTEVLPEVEVATGSMLAGGAVGFASGLVTGPLAPAASFVGTVFGSNGLPWATTGTLAAGDTYMALRDAGASHEEARAIAVPAGIGIGAFWGLSTNVVSGAAKAAIQREAVAHLSKGAATSVIGRYASMVGTGALTGGGSQTVRELAQVIASTINPDVKSPEDPVKHVVEAYAAGAFLGGLTGGAADVGGKLVGKAAKQLNFTDAIKQFQQAMRKYSASQAAQAKQTQQAAQANAPSATSSGSVSATTSAAAKTGVAASGNPAPVKKADTVFEDMFNQSVEAFQREKEGLSALQKKAQDAATRLQAAQGGDEQALIKATREARLAKADYDLAKAEAQLRRSGVVGKDRLAAQADAAAALEDMADAAMLGVTKEQLSDLADETFEKAFGNPIQQFLRGVTSAARSYELKFRLAFKADPEADRIASNFSLTKSVDQMRKLEKRFEKLFQEAAKDVTGWDPKKLEARVIRAQVEKVSFTHKQLANQTVKGHQRTAKEVTWEGSKDELITLYNQIKHDIADTQNGHVHGNGYDLDYKTPTSLARQVIDKVEMDPELKGLADTAMEFYRKRAPYVEKYIWLKDGERVKLPETFSGRVRRDNTHDLELDPRNSKNTQQFVKLHFGSQRKAKTTKNASALRREPESRKPILKSGAFENLLYTNKSLARSIAFMDSAPIHQGLLNKSQFQSRLKQAFGESVLHGMIQKHLGDIVSGVAKAEHAAEKAMLGTVRNLFPIRLAGDLVQYAKQQSSVFTTLAFIKDKTMLARGLYEFDKNRAFYEKMFGRDVGVQQRFEQVYSTATGIPSAKMKDAAPGWYDKVIQMPIREGDKESALKAMTVVYLDQMQQGVGHAKAVAQARKVNDITNSTGRVEMLPSMNRTSWAAFAPFMTQPQLVMSRMADMWSDMRFATGSAGADRAKDALVTGLAGFAGIKLGMFMYAATGAVSNLGYKAAVGTLQDDDVDNQLGNLWATTARGGVLDYPFVNELMHLGFLNMYYSAVGQKMKGYRPRTAILDIAKDAWDSYAAWGEIMTNPETNKTWGYAMHKWLTGANAIYIPGAAGKFAKLAGVGTALPGKPIQAIIDVLDTEAHKKKQKEGNILP